MSNTWQALQWFDLEIEPSNELNLRFNALKQSGKQFDSRIVEQLLKDSPFENDIDVQQLVDQFNDMLHTLH